jgi:hypothetical protein
MFRRAAGVAAAGAVGGAVLTEVFSSPARAAGTTVEQGAVAPSVVPLADAATVSVDASAGNDFRLTMAASRTIGMPSNPTDGQKITIQITQGSAGDATATWSSAFQFGAGLPQPTLSTAPGATDLLGFIYNATKGTWLCVAFVPGFTSTIMASPTPTPTPTATATPTITPTPTPTPTLGSTYRLFAGTSGPATPVSYSGPFLAGVLFEVTSGGMWFDGYWWWVCPSGQSTAPQLFALWAVYNGGTGALVESSSITSGTLVPGQWNYVPLSTPIPLAPGVCYNACTGFNGNFPDTQSQFGAGEPLSSGISNGPLVAFSDQSGSNPAPFSMSQGVFSVASSDPTDFMPANGNVSDNLWMDLQVGTTAPAGATYRLWPSYPTLPGSASGGYPGYTLATEIRASTSCTLDKVLFYSPSGSTALPTQCAIWNVNSQSVVSGTDNTAPSWSGAAGSGWVSCAYSGVTLPAGDYRVAVFYAGGANWFLFTNNYWGTGPGSNGITAGPLTAPGLSTATGGGQGMYNAGTWGYPDTYGAAGDGENYWIDLEVTSS